MWTPSELASRSATRGGRIWRIVEHQYTAASRKLADSAEEQDVLETVLEASKPRIPPEATHLGYLLATPFRYDPVPPGSRFRRPGPGLGVFYGAEALATAFAEFGYGRLRFFAASADTPLPRHENKLTAFKAEYRARRLDLTTPPLDRDRALWTDPEDYGPCQLLAERAREAKVEALRYESVRDPERSANVALLSPDAFARREPMDQQTWYLYISGGELDFRRAQGGPGERITFERRWPLDPAR
jgi:hypothetical protein